MVKMFFILVVTIVLASHLGAQPHEGLQIPRHQIETAYPFISNSAPENYDAFDQNFDIAQDSFGTMYFANGDGALIYDGVKWQLIPLANDGTTYSIACAKDQTIYVGGAEEIGYLDVDSKGKRSYVSLLPKMNVKEELGTVRKIIATEHGIYFHTGKKLFLYRSGKIERWEVESDQIAKIFWHDEHLYVSFKKRGLAKMTDTELSYLEGLDHLSGYISVLLSMGSKGLLVGTSEGHMFAYAAGNLQPFKLENEQYLLTHKIRAGLLLPDSTFALATRFGGLVVVDAMGHQRLIINNKKVIPSQKVLALFIDNRHMLWLGLDYGISKLEYPSRFSHLDAAANLEGVVTQLARHQEELYIATEYGINLYKASGGDLGPHVEMIFETQDFVDDMLSFGDNLLFTNNKGVYSWDGKTAKRITENIAANSLQRSRIDTNRVFVGHQSGLRTIYYKQNTFLDEGDLGGVVGDVYAVVEMPSGSLWLETSFNAIRRISFKDIHSAEQLIMPKVDNFDEGQGLPNTVGRLFNMHDQLFYRQIHGDHMYHFDKNKQVFEKDSLFHAKLGLNSDSTSLKVRMVDEMGNIWFDHYGPPLGEARMVAWSKGNGAFELQNLQENRIFDLAGKGVYPEPEDKVVWYIGKKRILRHDLHIKPTEATRDFYVTINSVKYQQDSMISFGRSNERPTITLPFLDNSFRFEYACLISSQAREVSYQHFLQGFDQGWSNWGVESTTDYTNLSEGEYVFNVRARDMSGELSEVDTFSFTILPPWHRSWWAIVLYILAGMVSTAVLIRWKSNQLRRDKLALQQIVEARTAALQIQNEQLEDQKNQLSLQADDLKAVDKVKSRLLANISHEFRTPLTLIKGPLEQAVRFPEADISNRHLKMMRRNTDRLLRLVNQLLDLSKIDAGTLPLNHAEGNLYQCLRAAASAFSSHAAQRNLDYQIQVPSGQLWAAFDREKMEEVVYNLLSNAFKFTPDDGSISLMAQYGKGILELRVSDSGRGIPASDQVQIFDRFYQVDTQDLHSVEGSGIGLSLIKEFVDMMKGNITVDSKVGEGTSFTVQIPIAEIERGPSPTSGLLQSIQQGMPVDVMHPMSKKSAGEARILIVEDNSDMRMYVAEQLESQYKISFAGNGPEGLEAAKRTIPDLVISDVMMPEMDGMRLCELLKTDERTSHIPVVMLTAKAGLEHRITGLETGADAYLTKPFQAQELVATVNNLIEQRKTLRDLFTSKINQFSPKELEWNDVDQLFIRKILDLLETRYNRPDFTVPEMQKALAMSKTQLHRKMKALTNQAPGEFLRNFRLKRAAQILQKGENVSQAAYSVGFNSLSYFAKCFKELHGVSPSVFKKKMD